MWLTTIQLYQKQIRLNCTHRNLEARPAEIYFQVNMNKHWIVCIFDTVNRLNKMLSTEHILLTADLLTWLHIISMEEHEKCDWILAEKWANLSWQRPLCLPRGLHSQCKCVLQLICSTWKPLLWVCPVQLHLRIVTLISRQPGTSVNTFQAQSTSEKGMLQAKRKWDWFI